MAQNLKRHQGLYNTALHNESVFTSCITPKAVRGGVSFCRSRNLNQATEWREGAPSGGAVVLICLRPFKSSICTNLRLVLINPPF